MPVINFNSKGEGYPVILIHGFCLDLNLWNEIKSYLSSDFEIYAIDLPGFGNSPSIEDLHISLEEVAQELQVWCQEEGIEEAIFIGHSLGGYVALALAELFPSLVKGLGLIHSTAYADSDENKTNRDKALEFIARHGHEKWINTFVPSLFGKEYSSRADSRIEDIKVTGRATNPNVIKAYTLAMRNRKNRFEVWKKLEGHCLLVGGTEDIRISSEVSEDHIYNREEIDGYILNQIGHMSMIEDPQKLAEIINIYLRKVNL